MHAQNNKGIKWITGLSWQQVKEKAKHENKYIFLDVFATWCGPCKMMDKNVYSNDTLGDYFNKKFISVRVQTDKTARDDDFVRSWYKDAISIQEQYRIDAYPSFIFLTPDGSPIHQASGYKVVDSLIALAKVATKPGKVFEDPYAEYDRLIEDYHKGIQHHDRMVYMIKTAEKFDTALANELSVSHNNYLLTLKPSERYTKEFIEFKEMFLLGSKGQSFKFFYKDGDIIDKVMNEKGYAAKVVDRTVFSEIIEPFFEMHMDSLILKYGKARFANGERAIKPDYNEADWKTLEKLIKKQFNKETAKRNVLAAQIDWYNRHSNYRAYVKYSEIQFEKYPANKSFQRINEVGWDAFLYVTDKKILKKIINQTQLEIQKETHKFGHAYHELYDTHANLLYKIGKTQGAIEWETKALQLVAERKDVNYITVYQEVIDQMSKGVPTYGVQLLK
jgi:thioredoxin-related protein